MRTKLPEYMKALVPLAVGVTVAVVDKLLAGDAVPDLVWLSLMGIAVPVARVPNRSKK